MRNLTPYSYLLHDKTLSVAEQVELSLYKSNGFLNVYAICFMAEAHFIGVSNRLKFKLSLF
ncbi:hypothetical protein [Acidiluteibacter ferrifornacis]|uniref:Uncharacterized protein n=1 Tax=Acidiluteibacter ferrifornacis TaxID=2692424 RepID=A0A6N9NHB6_9FLAO|nr:hypothetical protein [Acidiluteibacter ferrifornacis]NBG66068.1 hypothetical protein [Acidiluteibacter ferrifornacis]